MHYSLLWFFTFAFLHPGSSQVLPTETIYSIHVPQIIRPGYQITATVANILSVNPIEVTANFASADRRIDFTRTQNVASGASTKITLREIPINYGGSKKFNMTFEGVDAITREVLFRNSTTNFVMATKSLSIVIQTNKAIYQPGQIIKFRAICMNSDLRPLTGVVTYKVQDPKNNVIYLESDIKLNTGVATGKLALNKHAMEGDYAISFEYKGTKEKVTVAVQSYKLPKFEVKVSSPKVIYPDTEGFNVYVSANYTFGQPVYGKAVLRLERKSRSGGSLTPPRILTKNIKIFEGKTTVMITREEIKSNIGIDFTNQKLEVIAFVTETVTSTTLSDTIETDLKKYRFQMQKLFQPQIAKPGLKYKALVKVSEQDGNLLMDSDRIRNSVELRITYSYKKYNKTLSKPVMMNFAIPPSGLVNLEIDLRKDNFTRVAFIASLKGFILTRQYWSVRRALSPSGSYIQVTPLSLVHNELTAGTEAEVVIRTSESVRNMKLMIMARGDIIQDTMIIRPIGQTFHSSHRFMVTQEMIPVVTVIASYVREDNKEVVADSLELNVRLALENQMRITTSDNSVDAGSVMRINVTTSSPSFIALKAIDQSVLLLKSANEITQERIENELSEYSASNSYRGSRFYQSSSQVAEDVFRNAKVNILTNAFVYKFPINNQGECSYYGGRGFVALDDGLDARFAHAADAGDAFFSNRISGKTIASPSAARTRTLFPETWLWTTTDTGADGMVSLNLTAPDTITSWQISAFSMSETQGLGIAAPQELTVFRKFFVSLNMPLKITRGEIIIVQAIVFNYYDESLTANLNLNGLESDVELLRPGDSTFRSGPQRQVIVPAGGTVSVKYPLRVNRLGEVPIRVTANSSRAVDSVVRNVFVKPEGIEQCYSTSLLITKSPKETDPTFEELSLRVPQGVIAGSVKATLHTYGDILGSAMTNLDRLVRVPTGCGEQNMINFAPTVFVTLYLQQINQLSKETMKKSSKNIVDGYMNQLRYKRSDGSFSAFGERDPSGSTWLTAFVLKCFNLARELQPNLIEKVVIDQAVNFLIKQQDKDGSFKEPGRVIHQAMQGGVNNDVTMTAYVLIALTETTSMKQTSKLTPVIRRAISFLKLKLDQLEEPLELALVTYALSLYNSQEGRALFDQFAPTEDLIQENRDFIKSTYSPKWRPPYARPSSYRVESTAYLLLTLALHQDVTSSLPHLKWLVSKQNELGGYSSTQDTVIAIQALWSMARLLQYPKQALDLTVIHSADEEFEEEIAITEQNFFVYNSFEIPPLDGTVALSAAGSGIGVAQLSVCYNIPTSPYEEEPFRCKLNVTGINNNNAAWLEFCCTSREDIMDSTGMFLFEIGLLNGFTVDVIDEERRNPLAKLIELEADKVNVYYDQLIPNDELCTHLMLFMTSEIASVKPATVKAFEYYKPEKVVVRQYNVSGLDQSDACDVCGYECVGCPDPVLSDWKPWSACVEFCKAETTIRKKECFDPSLKKDIDFFRCGLTDEIIETRTCNKTFTCPNFSDGLWFEIPDSYRSYETRPCQPINGRYNGRSPYSGIPGSTLDGHKQYLKCSINLLNYDQGKPLQNLEFESSLEASGLLDNLLENVFTSDAPDGFTISFLAKPRFYKNDRPTVFISFGETDDQPILVMEKPIRRNHIRLAISVNYKRDFVDNIPLNAIPIGNWSHIMIIWDDVSGAKVIVNGTEVGQSSTIAVQASRKITKTPQFSLGRKANGNQQQQGYFSGSFSALHFWTAPLPESGVKGLSDYYKELIKNDGTEPLLSVRHIRELVPERQRQCFNEPTFLSQIYAEQRCKM